MIVSPAVTPSRPALIAMATYAKATQTLEEEQTPGRMRRLERERERSARAFNRKLTVALKG